MGDFPDLRSRLRSLTALRWGSLFLPVIAGIAWALFSYFESHQDAVDRAQSNVRLVRQYSERLVQTQTLLHDAVRLRMAGESETFLYSSAFHDFLANLQKSQDRNLGLAIVSEDGGLIASSSSFPATGKFVPSDELRVLRTGGSVFVDRIRLPSNGRDAILVFAPIVTDGFSGAIVSAVQVETMRGFLAGIVLGDREAASILRSDGKLLVRNTATEPLMLSPGAVAMQALQKASSGVYETVSTADGVKRIYAFTHLEDLPLVANFGVPKTAMWYGWLKRTLPFEIMLGALGGFSFILSGRIKNGLAVQAARREAEESRRRQSEAEKLAEQRRVMMQELNHRVKNNLALVEALIGMQMRRKENIDGHELRARVHAISEVHDLLYRTSNSYEVELGELIRQISNSPAIIPREKDIHTEVECEGQIPVNADKATPLALLTAELITNAVKHAFATTPEGGARITISLRAMAEGEQAELVVRDNGQGLRDGESRNSGLSMVRAFTQQLSGTLENENRNGAVFTLRFPL